MIRLAIATTSEEKIKGLKTAFQQFYKVEESELDIFAIKTNSGVPEQPFNDDIYKGALNRVNYLVENVNEDLNSFEYFISCEAGIETYCSILHFNVQVVCLYNPKTQKHTFAKSSGWQIPNDDIEEVRKSGLDSYMRNKGLNSLQELLDGTTRANLVTDAINIALNTEKIF